MRSVRQFWRTRKWDWPGGAASAAWFWVVTLSLDGHGVWWLKWILAIVGGGFAAIVAAILASVIEDRLRRQR